MAKRFTDTEKWEDPWYRRLSINYRMLWMYILDKCDSAGVWKADLEYAGHIILDDWKAFNRDKVLEVLNGRVHILGEGESEKWFIANFIKFQYGHLISTSRPHLKVVGMLKEYGVLSRVSDRVFDTPKTRQDNTSTTTIKVYNDILSRWNAKITTCKVHTLSENRIKSLKVRITEEQFTTNLDTILDKIVASDFLSGRSPGKGHEHWKATFDWVICNDHNYIKILEGLYDNKPVDPLEKWRKKDVSYRR